MLRICWIIAIAFGLAAPELAQSQQETQSAENGTNGQQSNADNQFLGIPVRIIEDEETVETRERREREREQREQEDLVAQQSMADATEAMNEATQSMKNAAWFSFGAVAIGTVLLIWTLLLTRSANRAALAGTAVAKKAVEVGRPWVIFSKADYFHLTECKTPVGYVEDSIMLQPELHNVGSTPALDLRVYLDFKVVPPNEIPIFEKGDPKSTQTPILPKDTPLGLQIFLTDEQANLVRTQRHKIVFYIYAEYTDEFQGAEGKERIAEMCICADFVGGDMRKDGLLISPFNFYNIGSQNRAT